ncbi:hypothetical protein [Bacillus sp. UNC322MFChir4.1]|uniref:hypothetical protein n=1 Tax=Bacillus sp. UNC322MFChir4.1 TaxID=1449045 RepID=UPI003FA43F80
MLIFATPSWVYFTLSVQGIDLNLSILCRKVQFSFFDMVRPYREMGHRYLEVMMEFFGTSSFEGIFIEGHNKFPEKAQKIKEKAILRAKEVAKDF